MSALVGSYRQASLGQQAVLTIPSIPRELWGSAYQVLLMGDPTVSICMLVQQSVVRGHDQGMSE